MLKVLPDRLTLRKIVLFTAY